MCNVHASALDAHLTYENYCLRRFKVSLNQLRLKNKICGQFYGIILIIFIYNRK